LIRFKIKELIAKKEFAEDRRITIADVAKAAGVHRMTISKMINQRGYVTNTDTLNRLCEYFCCGLDDLAEYVPEQKNSSENSKE
jgi:putative transcriptional regulator